MASSDNLDCVDPWLFRPSFAAEPWFSDAFAYDSDTPFTKALTNSFYFADDELSELLSAVTNTTDGSNLSSSPSPSPSPRLSPNLDTPRGGHSITISGSGSGAGFGSDPEAVSKRTRSVPGPVSGRIGKRKSRALKKSPTTFITADAANFRQMVQQITGVKLPSSGQFSSKAPVLKPEPQRVGAAGGAIHGCLPTLDTSAFLLEHHQQQVLGHGGAGDATATAIAPPAVGDIGGDGGAVGGRKRRDCESFACFPTLESGKVM